MVIKYRIVDTVIRFGGYNLWLKLDLVIYIEYVK